MSDQIERLFSRCRKGNRAAFIPYICAGDPNFARTIEVALTLERAGADLLELGIPFSDPIADGVVNQMGAQRALAAGATVAGVLDCVRRLRQSSGIPLVLYSYLNPLLQFGFASFHEEAVTAGVDGLLLLDLPPDEDIERLDSIAHIRLIAPTTPIERVQRIVQEAKGFLYYVSREGVTGVRDSITTALDQRLSEVRKNTTLPIVVGFGISTPEQARIVASLADGVVVGSAIVNLIANIGDANDLADQIAKFVTPIASAIHGARS